MRPAPSRGRLFLIPMLAALAIVARMAASENHLFLVHQCFADQPLRSEWVGFKNYLN